MDVSCITISGLIIDPNATVTLYAFISFCHIKYSDIGKRLSFPANYQIKTVIKSRCFQFFLSRSMHLFIILGKKNRNRFHCYTKASRHLSNSCLSQESSFISVFNENTFEFTLLQVLLNFLLQDSQRSRF